MEVMRLIVKGIIKEVDCSTRIIKLETKYRIYYIRIRKGLYKKIKLFLGERALVIADITPEIVSHHYYFLNYVIRIVSLDNQYLCYDNQYIDKTLGEFLNKPRNLMFLDLEFSMQEYNSHEPFIHEIIQIGYLIFDDTGKEVLRYNQYVRPNSGKLSSRTCKFLNINNRYFFNRAVNHNVVYRDLLRVLRKYDPHIVVYGKNDIKALKSFYEINKLPPLDRLTHFINLASLITNYYHLDSEPGLFNLYALYYGDDMTQDHDAYFDAYVTSMVYDAFRKDVSSRKRSLNFLED